MLCLANQQEKGVVSGGYTASPTYIRQQFHPEICLLEAKTAFRKGAVAKCFAFCHSPFVNAPGLSSG
jgi:hypothetical protein